MRQRYSPNVRGRMAPCPDDTQLLPTGQSAGAQYKWILPVIGKRTTVTQSEPGMPCHLPIPNPGRLAPAPFQRE
jgi:hypothetical protein